MSKRLSSLSASFPAHNEEDNVGPMIEDLVTALPDFAERFEVIVVDDGSRDRTFERASAIAARDQRVRVIRHERVKYACPCCDWPLRGSTRMSA